MSVQFSLLLDAEVKSRLSLYSCSSVVSHGVVETTGCFDYDDSPFTDLFMR